jgi:hypothetical protein
MRIPARIIVLAAPALLASACSTTVELEEQHSSTPLFARVDANVGTFIAPTVRTAEVRTRYAQVEIGRISAARFEQAFAAMFTRTTPLPSWPPWRDTAPTGLDAVIELGNVKTTLEMSDNPTRPVWVGVRYAVCMFQPDGNEIKCWETSASLESQREGFPLTLREYLSQQFEYVIRDAVAKFMVSAEQDLTFMRRSKQP